MFGQHDNQSQQQDAQIPNQSIDGAMASMPNSNSQNGQNGGDGQTVSPTDNNWGHPGTPVDATAPPNPQPFGSNDNQQFSPSQSDSGSGTDRDMPHDLVDIKQQALNQLSPLVDHLDQNPEDKFRTLMMMIQASDDQSKIKDAYAAAEAIEDEKVRAQALLDVINEINYFTQHPAE